MFSGLTTSTDKTKTAAFTGHRTIVPPAQALLFGSGAGLTREEYFVVISTRLDTAIRRLISEGYDTFLCGMAAGFDLMAGLAVTRLIEAGDSLKLIALIPHPGQSYKFGADDKITYKRILSHCQDAYTVCEEYTKDCFHRRNDLLVDNSSAVVCYYDGSRGGTHYTVKRALRHGCTIINLY